jgi:hypothetical protein
LRVSSISVTVITPGAGCSITSTATVSSTGVTGCFTFRTFTFRTAFFVGAGLGFALATVRFVAFPRADLATLRALGRVAEFPLRRFARFCTFDAFLRLAMIVPPSGWCPWVALAGYPLGISDQRTNGQVSAAYPTSFQITA